MLHSCHAAEFGCSHEKGCICLFVSLMLHWHSHSKHAATFILLALHMMLCPFANPCHPQELDAVDAKSRLVTDFLVQYTLTPDEVGLGWEDRGVQRTACLMFLVS